MNEKNILAVIFVGVDCSEAMKTLTFNTIELPKLIHKKPLFLRNVNIGKYSPHISPQFILPATIPKKILIIYPSPLIFQFFSLKLTLEVVALG